ncbi:MAG: Yip1 family protein [bacterium]
MSNFLENFYGILFSPNQTLEKLKQDNPLWQGVLIVLFVSILSPLLNFNLFDKVGVTVAWLSFNIIQASFAGVLSWLFFASFLDVLARVFKQPGKIKEFLVLSSFTLVPWIFLGPVELLKTAGILGQVFGIIIGLAIWLWVIILVVMAIAKAYDLKLGKVLILLTFPSLSVFVSFYWFIGFFSTLARILSN